ncbi:hypothetical protein WMY93_003695 [Mugilogobius chulae]|uniref:SAM domain-containing protein n=1 Tax=Mugilogobius chulae TaxID=88201 RepID=A0AAW0Q0A7_9GOBI
MESLIQDKLREWNLKELIKPFEDNQINYDIFLSLDTSDRLEILIPKIGPRAKFQKRLKEYKKSLNRRRDEELMETNMDSGQESIHHMSNMSLPSQSLVTEQGILATQLFVLRHHLSVPAQDDLMSLFKSIIPNFTVDSLAFNTGRIKVYKRECRTGFFMYSSLRELLKETLESYGMKLIPKVINREQKICDIMEGKIYQELIKNKRLTDDDITLLWNCDGAPIGQNSIWPLQFTINELPYQIRKHVLVQALWCGTVAPDMAKFLRPFVDECCELERTPFRWVDSCGVTHFSRVFVLVCSSDAVARPLLRNSVQFNGEYGCDWCLHPGSMVDKGSGKVRSYAYNEQKPIETRREKMYRDDAIKAETSEKTVNGVKGVSNLLDLPVFDIVQGFVPEYSHAVLFGVTKQLVSLWLDQRNSTEPWYLGDKIEELDTCLLSLRPEIKITQSPISLKCRDTWKAVDWQAFLLFYGLYVLQPYLTLRYLNHFCRLSCSMHMLLQDSITQKSLNRVCVYLKGFVRDMAVLYGEEHVTFNCHQLIHLCDSVENWGPLWATSALGFERNNKDLQALLCDVINNSEDIVKKFSIWQQIPTHFRSSVFGKSDFSDLLNLNSLLSNSKATFAPLGKSVHLDISDSIKLAVQELLKYTPAKISAYECFTHGDRVYHCVNSKAADQTKCTIKQKKNKNGCYGEIHFCLGVKCQYTCTSDCQCPITPVFVAKMFDISPVFETLPMEHSADLPF